LAWIRRRDVKFSKMCDYKGVAHFIVKTGRKNIRILLPGQPYEKSFVVPIKKISNRRPAEYEPEDDMDDVELEEETDLTEETEELEDEFQPQ
jgi:hypothetical protein